MKYTLKYLLLGILMTGLSVFVVVRANKNEGWLGILLFGFATILYLLKLIFPNSKYLKNLETKPNKIQNRPFDEIYNDNGIFEFEETGFKINLDDKQTFIEWENIQAVFGYKIDLYTNDSICVDIFYKIDKSFRISEETLGWFQLMIHLKEKFPSINKNWEMEIAIPAFETKLTLIYEKEHRTFEESKTYFYKSI
ncbi:hypothetical protein [Flavobacterium sp. RS13.1]|uniref:hypothetical protein n=1 Tax=Flavobacterium sp. RS13.1 TaxID=3400345 RepID=UPI003AAB2A61